MTAATERHDAAAAGAAQARTDAEQALREVGMGRERAAAGERRAAQVQALLTDADARLADGKSIKRASERETRQVEVLESLQRLFPGVAGRMVDLCKPIQRRYNVAVTAAMGRWMDAVVVDTQRTAFRCIEYLKEQRVASATFLPLDSLTVFPLDERDRLAGKLVVDVVRCDAAHERALQYACGNTFVSETLNDARTLCYAGQSRKAVTLDGSVVHRSGMISGGIAGLADRAGRWDDAALAALQTERDEYAAELAALTRALVRLYHYLACEVWH